MNEVEAASTEAPASEPFYGGELTIARAAKLLKASVAEVDSLIAGGALAARTAPKPGGGEHTLVSLESVQMARSEGEAPETAAQTETAAQLGTAEPFPLDAGLGSRPRREERDGAAAREGRGQFSEEFGAAVAPASGREITALTEALERLSLMHGQLLTKLDELVEALRP